MRKGGRGHLGCVYFHEHPANSLSLPDSISLIWALWHQHSALEQKKEAGGSGEAPGSRRSARPHSPMMLSVPLAGGVHDEAL